MAEIFGGNSQENKFPWHGNTGRCCDCKWQGCCVVKGLQFFNITFINPAMGKLLSFWLELRLLPVIHCLLWWRDERWLIQRWYHLVWRPHYVRFTTLMIMLMWNKDLTNWWRKSSWELMAIEIRWWKCDLHLCYQLTMKHFQTFKLIHYLSI